MLVLVLNCFHNFVKFKCCPVLRCNFTHATLLIKSFSLYFQPKKYVNRAQHPSRIATPVDAHKMVPGWRVRVVFACRMK
jgi:hypothetical protein